MDVRDRPHITIRPGELADWLERHQDYWWIVDGDPRLTRVVDFPCPSEELAEALRRHDVDSRLLMISTGWVGPGADDEELHPRSLDQLPERKDPEAARAFLFSWSDLPGEWMLCEDPSVDIDDHDAGGEPDGEAARSPSD